MKDFFHHLLFPRESNNHRSKILHHSSLFLTIILFFLGGIFLSEIRYAYPHILGTSVDVTSEQLLERTNTLRQKEGKSPLVLNEKLSEAAALKAQDMFAKNYWAHNAPDGSTPWAFIKKSGYTYVYAGENLARGFTNGDEVISAWMASPSHRENMLSAKYQEVGFAIVDGELLGERTTLIVEMFGGTQLAYDQNTNAIATATITAIPDPSEIVPLILSSQQRKVTIESVPLIKGIGILILVLFIAVLLADVAIVKRKKIIRLAGHNADHILFLAAIMILFLGLSTGFIL